jgi:hypothetical protein
LVHLACGCRHAWSCPECTMVLNACMLGVRIYLAFMAQTNLSHNRNSAKHTMELTTSTAHSPNACADGCSAYLRFLDSSFDFLAPAAVVDLLSLYVLLEKSWNNTSRERM